MIKYRAKMEFLEDIKRFHNTTLNSEQRVWIWITSGAWPITLLAMGCYKISLLADKSYEEAKKQHLDAAEKEAARLVLLSEHKKEIEAITRENP